MSLAVSLLEKYEVYTCDKRDVTHIAISKCFQDLQEALIYIQYDIIVLATPMQYFKDIFTNISRYMNYNPMITDVGSLKGIVIHEAQKCIDMENFVPAHPMSGGSSMINSTNKEIANIFRDNNVIITPHQDMNAFAEARINEMWECTGAKIHKINPNTHDQLVALTSHSVQLLANIYGEFVRDIQIPLEYKENSLLFLCDMSHDDMWDYVFKNNARNIKYCIDDVKRTICKYKPKSHVALLRCIANSLQEQFDQCSCSERWHVRARGFSKAISVPEWNDVIDIEKFLILLRCTI